MTHIPPFLRSRRALGAIAIAGVGAWVVAPDATLRGLPFLLVLVCPLMMVFMMGSMHQMPADAAPQRTEDPYAPEALKKRLAALDMERLAVTRLLATALPSRPVPARSRGVADHVES